MKKYIFSLIVILVSLVFFRSTDASALGIGGRWKVYTTLVTAYDATNPNYRPGDKRLEKWVIKVKGNQATLKTQAGTIQGKKVGKAWLFEQAYDTGYGVIVQVHLVARLYSGKQIRGTNELRYFDSRAWLGYPYLGNDAFTFRGTRL